MSQADSNGGPQDRPPRARPKVLVISAHAVGAKMLSVGIRAYEVARVLQQYADVTLAAPHSEMSPEDSLPCVAFDPHAPRGLIPHVRDCDAVISMPLWPSVMRVLRASGARLIFDTPDPEPFSVLQTYSDPHDGQPSGGRSSINRRLRTALSLDRIVEALHIGHHITCANERQRDLWIGAMLAERLIDPELYDRDPSLRSVIDTVPHGVPVEPPKRTPAGGPRERFPEIGPEHEVVLWNGGIWRWFDAPTAVRAARLLAERRPNVRLVFGGASDAAPARRAAEEIRTLAAELGVLDRIVFFNDSWVPYSDWANWLLEADCALSTHIEQLETHYAFRTRLLDCFWTRLPIVCSQGDVLADRVEREDLGATARPGDVEALAQAIEHVLDRGRAAYSDQLERVAAEYSWPVAAEPFVRYVTSPELPPRLGDGLAHRLSRRSGQRMRSAAYQALRPALAAAGMTEKAEL